MKKVLKVKDDKPLSDLEEYGFEEWDEGNEYRYYGGRSLNIQIKSKDRVVRLTAGTTRESVILFKMFEAGILEETYIEDKKYDNRTRLEQENELLKKIIDDVKVEISVLMSRYYFEKDFNIEDAHLDNLLKMLDKVNEVK